MRKETDLLQFGEGERVVVFHSELHEAHVGWVREFGDDAESREKPVGQTQFVCSNVHKKLATLQ